jgi:hypothetical protein
MHNANDVAHRNLCLIAYRHLQRVDPDIIPTLCELLVQGHTPEEIGAFAGIAGDFQRGLFTAAAEHLQREMN